MTYRRRIWFAALLLPIFALISLYYVAVYRILPYSAIRPYRVTPQDLSTRFPDGALPSNIGLNYSNFDVTVEDSILLKGWFIRSKIDSARGTVIVLHGIGSSKELMLGFANSLANLGYNSILFDSRAHGQSGGINCTFGYYEKYDVKHYIDESLLRFSDVEPIGIYGTSLGGAIALQTMAIDNRIKCGIIASTFGTLREVVYDYFKLQSHLPLKFISDEALDRSQVITNFPVDSIRPEESAKHILQPVLIVHGAQDRNISINYGRRIFNNIASAEKQWYEIPTGDHNNLGSAGGQQYAVTIEEFLHKYLRR